MSAGQKEHSKPVRLAHAALRYAQSKEWRKVEGQLARLNAECGPDGLGDALVAWCEAICDHATDGKLEFSARIRIAPWAVETGQVEQAPRESVAWSARLIEARAHGDRGRFVAVMDELNAIPDGFERGRYVGELIQCVALSINSLPRGYALMGRGRG